jgi:hypothetical protein
MLISIGMSMSSEEFPLFTIGVTTAIEEPTPSRSQNSTPMTSPRRYFIEAMAQAETAILLAIAED